MINAASKAAAQMWNHITSATEVIGQGESIGNGIWTLFAPGRDADGSIAESFYFYGAPNAIFIPKGSIVKFAWGGFYQFNPPTLSPFDPESLGQ